MAVKNNNYNDNSITMLKGAERVRKRPAVIFGSDSIEGCEHSVFEILSNSVDEAKEGYGDRINITVFSDRTIRIEDFGRGVPLDYNEKEHAYNWELVYCELYAGGKYNNNESGSNYKYSLGLNGLGAAATQCSSEFMKVQSYHTTEMLEMNFKKGEPDGELIRTPLSRKEQRTGTIVTWRPDLEVFTDTNIPKIFFETMLDRQAVVNAGLRFVFRWQTMEGDFEEKEYYYEHGIKDYIARMAGAEAITPPQYYQMETRGRDRADKDDYSLKAEFAFCFSNAFQLIEYYHNSSFLEHGGSPDKATKTAFVYAIDKYIKQTGKYNKNDSKITFADIEDCLVLVINSSSTETSYANQTKKAITNEFIAEAMTDYLKSTLEIYFAENPLDADKIASQVLANKRREQILRAEGEKNSTILVAEGKKQAMILDAEAQKQRQILLAEAEKESKIRQAEGEAEAIRQVQEATAEGIKMINDAAPSEAVIAIKGLEAFEKAADGKATKIIIPSEIQSIAGLATSVSELIKKDKE